MFFKFKTILLHTVYILQNIMTLLETITEDYKQAMKAHDDIKKSALNYLLAQIKNKKIELRVDLTDDDIISVIKKEIKSLNETLLFLWKANKTEEIAIETQKKSILESYLPAMLSREATETLIDETILKLGITDIKTQRWILMKDLMGEHKSELDWSIVNDIINSKL